MNIKVLLFLLLNITLLINGSRKINWFIDKDLITNNLNFYNNNSLIIDGYYPCCNIFLVDSDGSFLINDTLDNIEFWSKKYIDLKIDIIPVINSNNIVNMHTLYLNSTNFINEAINILLKFGFTGYIFNYTGDCDYNKFTLFLNKFSNELHRYNKKFGLCVNLNKNQVFFYLNKISVYRDSNVDFFINEGSFYVQELSKMYLDLNDLITNVTKYRTFPGLSIQNWNETYLNKYLRKLICNDINNIAILNIYNLPDYFNKLLKKYTNNF